LPFIRAICFVRVYDAEVKMNGMSRNRKLIWSFASVIVPGGLLTVTIIALGGFYKSGLFWLLLITVPLMMVGIYNLKQTLRTSGDDVMGLKEATDQNKYEWLSRLINFNKHNETDLKVLIGNDQCSQPYRASIFNIETRNNIHPGEAVIPITIKRNKKNGKNACEETLRTYCLTGQDLVWQVESDFIGCRADNGNFNSKLFKQIANRPEIKMIEFILTSPITSGCSPDSTSGIEISANPGKGDSINKGLSSTAFLNAEGMIHFLDTLRELSGRKPIGFRLCINRKKEFHEICYAIRKTHIIPDFITVEGSFEITGSVPVVKEIDFGMPLYEALLFVSQTLQVYGLEKEIKIIASGRITSGIDILKVLVLGANAICSEKPDYRSLFPINEVKNINDFQRKLMSETVQAMRICGFMNVSDISLSKFFSNLDLLHSESFAELNRSILYSGKIKKIFNSNVGQYERQNVRKKMTIV
jgi:hypothetical protein